MSEILVSHHGPAQRARPAGGWVAPLLVVIVVTLLASGVLSSDPEPPSTSTLPASATPAMDAGETAAPGASVDDQADFVEFGFDSQLGMMAPRGQAGALPAGAPQDARRPARQGPSPM